MVQIILPIFSDIAIFPFSIF